DCGLAFDVAGPVVAGRVLSEPGLLPNLGGMLMSARGNQRRWLQLAGCAPQGPQRVGSGLPEGDPWSPAALCAMLAPLNVQLRADHRAWKSPGIAAALRAPDNWTTWSATLCLKENEKKKQLLHRRPSQWRLLAEAGVDPASVRDAIDALEAKITGG
ncbi:unnamed protein product, partial [Prorocentrum cordatum]